MFFTQVSAIPGGERLESSGWRQSGKTWCRVFLHYLPDMAMVVEYARANPDVAGLRLPGPTIA